MKGTALLNCAILGSAMVLLFATTNAQTYPHPTTGIQSTYLGACTVNGCGGTYVDNGGTGGNYSNSINNIYRTFCPSTPGQCIRLTFTQFNVEPPGIFGLCYDSLMIGNGPTQNSPRLWSGCGSTIPPVITSTDPSGCITVRFYSDGTVNAAGWRANITCVPCSGQGPSANLTTDCTNAQYVCDNLQPINANSQGPGLVADACISGCALSENYSNWYILNVTQAGQTGFTITPTPTTADYDFSLYGPVSGGCSSLGNPIRCSYAANTGNTGMRTSSLDASEDVNGDGWVSAANLAVGTYYLLINQWAYEPNSSFRLDFNGTSTIGLPSPTISSNTPVCANQTLQLTGQNVAGATYNWSGPGGWTSTQQNPTRNPPVAGAYSFYYTVNGCNSPSVNVNVTVNPLPTPTITPATSSICPGQNITLSASGGGTYAWSNSANTQNITVSPASTTTYTVTVTNANNCSASVSRTVNVGANLVATITPSSPSVCTGGNITLTAGGGTIYSWSNSATSQSITVSPTSNTTYSVTISDGGTCTGTTATSVTVHSNPIATISPPTSVCAGASATLNAGGGTSYSWSNSSGSQNITVNPASTTNYSVTVTDINSCTATASTTVTVNMNPIAAINSSATSICEGYSATLNASGGTSYAWSNSASTQNIIVTPSSTTAYSVTVSDGNLCSAIASATIAVNTNPIASINSSAASICEGNSATLNASGGTLYSWSNSASAQNITITPSSTTTYTVTVTDGNSCSATASSTVTVNTNPVAAIIPNNPSICEGASLTLNANVANSYAWSNSSTTTSINVSPLSTTNYSVTIYDGNSCSSTASATVTVNPNPVVSISSSAPEICEGENVTLTSNVGTTFSWSTSETTASITATPGATSAYSVTVFDGNNCSGTATTNIIVHTNPVISISPQTSNICGGQNVPLTALGGLLYSWSNSAIGSSITVTPFNTTTYSVTGTDGNNCSAVGTADINVTQSISLTTSVDDVNCFGGSDGAVVLSVIGGQPPLNYSWSNNATSQNLTGVPAGTYTVTVTDNSCASTITATVAEPSAIDLTESHNDACIGVSNGSIDLTTSGGKPPYSFLWNDNNSLEDRTGLAPTAYSITLTDANSCTESLSITIAENNVLGISYGLNHPTCAMNGGDGSISVSVSGATQPIQYTWSNSGSSDFIDNLVAGNYSVTVTDATGCTAESAMSLSYQYDFTIDAVPSTTIISGKSTPLGYIVQGYSDNLTATWTPDDGLSCNPCDDPDASPISTTLYEVIVSSVPGCTSSDTVTIFVVEEHEVVLPNVFTPNGDGYNDDLLIFGTEALVYFEMKIFNRWGEKVFESFDPAYKWDGKHQGKELQPDVYVYQIKTATLENSDLKLKKGTVTLIR